MTRRDVRGAISSDGSRVFWTNGSSDEGPLFTTDTAKGKRSRSTPPRASGSGRGRNRRTSGRSALPRCDRDGARVFFTDTWPLTRNRTSNRSSRKKKPPNHPRARTHWDGRRTSTNTTSAPAIWSISPPHGRRKRRCPRHAAGQSEDGSYIYFVATACSLPAHSQGTVRARNSCCPIPKTVQSVCLRARS